MGTLRQRVLLLVLISVSAGALGIHLYRRNRPDPTPPIPGEPFRDDLSAPLPNVKRRKIISMEEYVATADPKQIARHNVILVLLDSFRVDALRATGGPREVMPAVEALAREGRAFPDCITPATQTNYAMPAAHSSHYPLRERVHYVYPPQVPYPRVLIYDLLKALGWKTAFFSSGDETWAYMTNYYKSGGLDVHFHAKDPGALSPQEQVRASSEMPSLDDSITITEAMKWIDRRGDSPFYLSLVLNNCHLPFPVPADFKRRFGPSKIDFKITRATFPPDRKEEAKGLYADSLAYVDSQLARLFDHLRQRGEWDRTIVVIAGDHGEAFYEHGIPAHANAVFDETARVPLVIRAPGRTPAVDARPADLIDIPPTLVHLLGLPPHPSFQGLNLFAPDARPDRVRYSIVQGANLTQIAAYRSGFKLIREIPTERTALFDLKTDPGEKTEVSAAHPQVKSDLLRWISMWCKAQLEYYKSPSWISTEYPPILEGP